jgi:hypothetical protein
LTHDQLMAAWIHSVVSALVSFSRCLPREANCEAQKRE